MGAVIEHRPDWVIDTARKQAERIVEPGLSGAYDYAVDCLELMRGACSLAGRQSEWQEYFDDLRARHRRKYKLMALLEPLAEEQPD